MWEVNLEFHPLQLGRVPEPWEASSSTHRSIQQHSILVSDAGVKRPVESHDVPLSSSHPPHSNPLTHSRSEEQATTTQSSISPPPLPPRKSTSMTERPRRPPSDGMTDRYRCGKCGRILAKDEQSSHSEYCDGVLKSC